jgi:spore maturation protein CgeB
MIDNSEKLKVLQSGAAPGSTPLRILAVSRLIQGTNDYAFVRAFRRAGHSVSVVPFESFIPTWRSKSLRVLRRVLTPLLVREYARALIAEAEHFRPDLFFVFKGDFLTPDAMAAVKATGAIAINFFPDTGFADHGAYLPQTIAMHDWVFTTKPAGVADLAENYNFRSAEFIPHAFDPESHAPVQLDQHDRRKYECDVVFIGNTSPKKQRLLEHVRRCLPDISMRIWGPYTWRAAPSLASVYQGAPVLGTEYAKAIRAARINLGILFEGGPSAPEGDVITARTFEIPGAGGFMLHERTKVAMQYFEEGKECAFFSHPDDLVAKIDYYLKHPHEREAIAAAGRQRALSSGYSVDARVETVLAKYAELRRLRMPLR